MKVSKNQDKAYDRTRLRALLSENRALKREIQSLRWELEGKSEQTKLGAREDEFRARLKRHARCERIFSRTRYSAYIWDQARQTTAFQLYTRLIRTVRRYTFVRTALRVTLAVSAAIHSGAILLLCASIFLISLPFTLLIFSAPLLLTFLLGSRIHRINQDRMKDRKILVFFPPKKRALRKKSFFCGMVLEQAKKDGQFCVIVSPYFWSSTGIDGRKGKPYLASRAEKENILMVRRHYYFIMKKRIFSKLSTYVTEIY